MVKSRYRRDVEQMIGKYTLMHKNIPVCDLEIDIEDGRIMNVGEKYDSTRTPVATTNRNQIDRRLLNRWFESRVIPASRQHIDEVLKQLDISNTQVLALKSYALSLNDQYWVKPENQNLKWEKINFFDNDFSSDVGQLLLLEKNSNPNIDLKSPDNSSDGWLKKRWKSENGSQYLYKGGSDPFDQEPYNEEIASRLIDILGINHATYKQVFDNGKSMSVCQNFINRDTEYIPASRFQAANKQLNHQSDYQHLIHCGELVGISSNETTDYLNRMLAIDYLISNTDRHWFNFGYIRDANTLEYKGFAPIFDNGTSLYHDNILIPANPKAKTFAKTQNEQLKFIKDLSWYEPVSNEKITEIITNVLGKHDPLLMTTDRIKMITDNVIEKSNRLMELKHELG